MSNLPYGLRGDPFAPPATLSAKDASRLIRRRVRAFNGDGGALFPIDTCDLIHELTDGVPDAMLALASAALRNAADEGAPAVSPAHVRKATKTRPGVPSATAAIASDTPATQGEGAERATGAIDAPIEVAEEAERGRATSSANDNGPSESEQTLMAWAGDDDEDLPPFQPAAITLPSRPSENLDPFARDWVSRFIPTSGSDPAAGETARVSPARTLHDVTPEAAPPPPRPGPPSSATERVAAAVYAASAPRRRARRHAPRRRRRSGGPGLLITIATLCVIAFVVRMSTRGTLVPPGGEPVRPTPTSAPVVERRTDVHEPRPTASSVREPASTDAPTAGPRGPLEPAPVLRPPVPKTSMPELASASGSAPGSVEPTRRAAPTRKFGLEVATFIFEERARVERERLLAIGLRARVVTTLEYGSRVYRVVLGGYPDPAAAERAADSLLSNGIVLQARVVSVSY